MVSSPLAVKAKCIEKSELIVSHHVPKRCGSLPTWELGVFWQNPAPLSGDPTGPLLFRPVQGLPSHKVEHVFSFFMEISAGLKVRWRHAVNDPGF